jgi:anti-sigma regulatory factor (Ser/Thr protein kinase)
VQEDDITGVLVRRTGATEPSRRSFARQITAIDAITAFTEEVFSREGIDASLRYAVDFTLEERFTNMVKYSKNGDAEIDVVLSRISDGIEVRLTDFGVDPFDVTQSPDVDINRPIERRAPGGLGLHLIRRMVDSIDYQYIKERRESRITFRKTLAGPANAGSAQATTKNSPTKDTDAAN